MSGEKIILDYAKGPSMWPGRIRRGLLMLCLLIVTLILINQCTHVSPLLAWYWQRQCCSYALPPTEIVVETDPKSIAELRARRPTAYATASTPVASVSLNRVPPSAWVDLAAKAFGNVANPSVIFLHERISRGAGGGNARLVAVRPWHMVTAKTPPSPGGVELVLYLQVINEGTTHRLPALLSTGFVPFGPLFKGGPDPLLRIYAGQPDPTDPSHFTFDYEMWGQRDTVDGYLEATDSVTLLSRHPPAPPTTATTP